MMISCSPEATASSTTYWMVGLSTSGSISLGWALVAGRNRVPRPAAGNTPLRTRMDMDGSLDQTPDPLAIDRRLDPTSQVAESHNTPARPARLPSRAWRRTSTIARPHRTLKLVHVHAQLAQDEDEHDEGQHPAHDAREQRAERPRRAVSRWRAATCCTRRSISRWRTW